MTDSTHTSPRTSPLEPRSPRLVSSCSSLPPRLHLRDRGALQRTGLLIITFLICLAGVGPLPIPSLFSQIPHDRGWVPVPAESLQDLADAIERARSERNSRRERDALLLFSERLLEPIPDGGFPIGGGRWIGPGGYLRMAVRALDEENRARFSDALDLLFEARYQRPDLPRSVERWLRDLPVSETFDHIREEIAASQLEAGRTQSWLELAAQGKPRGVDLPTDAVSRWLSPVTERDVPELARPYTPVISALWPSPGDLRSPWKPGAIRVEPIFAADRTYLTTPDGVHCWDNSSGRERWFFPFVSDAPPTLPGTIRRPTLCGPTLVVTTERGIYGLDREFGTLRWELRGEDLFPPAGANPENLTASPLLSISPPALSEHGVVIAATRLISGSLDLRVVLLDAAGKVLWNRDAGSATGATHLALGSVLAAPIAHGNTVFISTGRGSILAHSLLDGALLWTTTYSGFAPGASRDALKNAPRPRDARLECDGPYLFGTALDSNQLSICRRNDGGMHCEIPLGDQRWWGLNSDTPESTTILLASPDHVTSWIVDERGTRALPPAELEPEFPRFTGPPIAVAREWWIPHESGVYRLDEKGSVISVVDLAPNGTVRGVSRKGDQLLISGDGFVEMRQPRIPPPNTLQSLWREVARGQLDALPNPLPPLDENTPIDARAEEERVARTILWQLRRPGVDVALRQRAVPAAVARIVRLDQRTRAAVREAVAAEKRGEVELAAELCWLALSEAELDLPIAIAPLGPVPLELVVRQVLTRLRDDREKYPQQERWEERASKALREGTGLPTLDGLLDVFRRYPGTTAGRRAALDAAESLYRYGNLRLALDHLEKLVLFEPNNAEAVEARFRIVELARELGDAPRAQALLTELTDLYGELSLTQIQNGEARVLTVAERVAALAETIPPLDSPKEPGVVDLPLQPVWRTRTELEHQRNLVVVPVPEKSDVEFLTISRRSIELRNSQTGDRLWHRTLPRIPKSDQIPMWSDVGRLGRPIALDGESLWVTDRRELFRIHLEDGQIAWSQSLPTITPPSDDRSATPIIDTIEESAFGDGIIVVRGIEGKITAFDATSGTVLWTRELTGALEGPLQTQDGYLLIGTNSPPRVELWRLNSGEQLWSFEVEPLGTTLAQEPWFAPKSTDSLTTSTLPDLFLFLEKGEVIRIDPNSNLRRWAQAFPQMLKRMHRPEGMTFWIAEMYWKRDQPALYAIAPDTGELLWIRPSRLNPRALHQVLAYDGDLYLVEGDYNQRVAVCLEVPRAFHPLPTEDTRELRTRWTSRLSQSWDIPRMRIHQDWILLEDVLNCDLSILSRETGIPIAPREGFETVLEFLRGRQQLYFAGFVGETLVLQTKRGGLGLRAPDPIESRARLWARLEELPLGGGSQSSSDPVQDSIRTFQSGHIEESVTLLESAIEEPSLDLNRRRQLHYRLEGLNEELGELKDLDWRIPRLEVAPVVDGSLEEAWNAAVAWPIQTPRYFHPIQGGVEDGANWRGKRDLSLVVLAAWSDVGFHLALDVQDDSVQVYDKDLDYWNGDCLLLAFDYLGDGGTRPDSDDQLMTLALTVPNRRPPGGPGGGGAGGQQGANPPPPPESSQPEGQFQVLRKGDGSGVVYEVMIPWTTFREARAQESIPHPGMAFRMNLVLTDDDNGRASTTYMSLSTGQMLEERSNQAVWNVFIPDRFPRLLLGR